MEKKRNKVWGNALCASSAAGWPWPANIHETVVIELLMNRRNSKFLFRYSANEWCNNATMQLHNSIWMRGTGRWIPRAWCRGVWLCAGGSTREHQPAGQGNWPPCAISDAIEISLRTSISSDVNKSNEVMKWIIEYISSMNRPPGCFCKKL